jgi:hypothetical protein
MEALAGAAGAIGKHRPALLVESVKSDSTQLRAWLAGGDYVTFEAGINLLAVHRTEPILPYVS